MKAIWKEPISLVALFTNETVLKLPKNAEILCVQVQQEVPHIWFINPDIDSNETEERKFIIIGTGCCYNRTSMEYIGTIQISDGNLVFHIFEVKE
jgi:hypothetical protein